MATAIAQTKRRDPDTTVRLEGWVLAIEGQTLTVCIAGNAMRVELQSAALECTPGLSPGSVVRLCGVTLDGLFQCEQIQILNVATRCPFTPATRIKAAAATRARYRYLEFRDPSVLARFHARHRVAMAVSNHLNELGFISVETPLLATPSSSGTSEYRVSSPRNPELSYALSQSAQVYGQLAVIGGFERHYQWSHCFRDEDFRANRQPEFTQLQLDIAFIGVEGLKQLVEGLLKAGCNAIGLPFDSPVVLPHDKIQQLYGTDKPDLRFGAQTRLLPYVVENANDSDQNLIATSFPHWLQSTPSSAELQTAVTDARFELLGHMDPAVAPFLRPKITRTDLARLSLQQEWRPGLIPYWLGQWKNSPVLSRLLYQFLIGKDYSPPKNDFRFLWVDSFPLFIEHEHQVGRLLSQNNPFTAPEDEEVFLNSRRNKEFLRLKAQSFDLILNGEEVASGSILIHRAETQRHMFNALGLSRKEVKAKCGHILEALETGAPPMGEIAIEFDRLIAILCGVPKIKEVIAFPKTKQGYCPVSHADGSCEAGWARKRLVSF